MCVVVDFSFLLFLTFSRQRNLSYRNQYIDSQSRSMDWFLYVPTAQFFIKGFSAPYRQDRNRTGGGLLLFVREDVPSRILNPKSKTDIETLNLRKRKWFLKLLL